MGCLNSHPVETAVLPTYKVTPVRGSIRGEKFGSFKVRIAEAIKRKDPILFEKTLQRFPVKLNDILGGYDSKYTILHHIAQNNFAEGMALILEFIIQKDANRASQALNSLDSEGNTPVMTCCSSNSPDSLEVLLRYDIVEINAKNKEGRVAFELALENSSSCMNLLNTMTTHNSKINSRYLSSSAEMMSPRNRASIPSINAKVHKRERSSTIIKDLTRLTSVVSLTRLTPTQLGPNTKLFSLINELKEHDTNFMDDEFTHDMFSIMNEEKSTEHSQSYKWLRPTEFLNPDAKKVKLFEGIDLNDVSTSMLAGCDLYSALAALTEFPQRLLNAFVIKEANKYGAYSVKFLISGVAVEIVLDDYFPCNEKSSLIYSKPVSNELWFLLLEKAFAKLYGSYSDVRSVSISEALELITGMPSSQHSLKDMNEEELWDSMIDYDKNNYIFCAGTYHAEHNKNRIFTIISLHETQGFKIIKLRDHFRDFPWEGLFSEKSKTWTKELKEEVGYTKEEKSCVFMELQEFVTYFDFLCVCHYHDGWIRNREDHSVDHKSPAFFEMILDQDQEVFISVHQRLPRYVEDSPEYNVSPVEILVAEKVSGNSLVKIASGEKDAYVGKQTTYAHDNLKAMLPAGKYIIRTKIRWVDEREHEFTLNTFSQRNLALRRVRADDYPNFIERVYADYASKIKEKYQLSNSCELVSGWCGPYLWIYGVNKGKKTWKTEIFFNVKENLKLRSKFLIKKDVMHMVVPPGEHRVIYAKRVNVEKVEVAWSLKHRWE